MTCDNPTLIAVRRVTAETVMVTLADVDQPERVLTLLFSTEDAIRVGSHLMTVAAAPYDLDNDPSDPRRAAL